MSGRIRMSSNDDSKDGNQDEDQDGGPLELSSDTLAALQSFYQEREEQQEKFENLKAAAADIHDTKEVQWSMAMFLEDWNASQFWYDDETAIALAEELLDGATAETRIAVISAPSVFVQLKNLLQKDPWKAMARGLHPQLTLLEVDDRFAIFPEYVHYNFEQPLQLHDSLKGQFHRLLADPPFLSIDCQTKTAMTIRYMARTENQTADEVVWRQRRLIICTGERMEDTIQRLYPRTQTTNFRPRHAQDRLSNDFRCYADYQGRLWS